MRPTNDGVVPVRVAVPGVAVVAAAADAAGGTAANRPRTSADEDEAPEVATERQLLVSRDRCESRAVPVAVEGQEGQQQVDVGLWRPPTW